MGLTPDGGNGCNTWTVNQGKDHEAQALQWGNLGTDIGCQVRTAINNGQGTDQDLFGNKAEKQGNGFRPLNAYWSKHWGEKQADLTCKGFRTPRINIGGEMGEKPDNNYTNYYEG